MNPDISITRRFLEALDPSPEALFTFQTWPEAPGAPAPRVLHGTLAEHADTLIEANMRGAAIGVMVNRGDLQGRTTRNVQEVRAVFVDLDGAPLEPVLEADPPPTIVVESSPGKWHAYWLVQGGPLNEFKPVMQHLAERFKGDRSVAELARVMRVPGFLHLKGEPFLSRLVSVREEVE